MCGVGKVANTPRWLYGKEGYMKNSKEYKKGLVFLFCSPPASGETVTQFKSRYLLIMMRRLDDSMLQKHRSQYSHAQWHCNLFFEQPIFVYTRLPWKAHCFFRSKVQKAPFNSWRNYFDHIECAHSCVFQPQAFLLPTHAISKIQVSH